MIAIVTAYIATCSGCSGLTFSGLRADWTKNYVAADLSHYEIGDKICFYFGFECSQYTVQDTGSFKGKNRFDILVKDFKTAVNFGKQQIKYLEL